MADARRELRERLLHPTLENAARTPFYRELWQGKNYDDITLKTLSELPLVRKADLFTAGSSAQLTGDQICDEVLSGGTTGNPFVTIRGKREQEVIADVFENVNAPDAPQVRLRGLQIQNPQHGTLVRMPADIRLHSVSIYDEHCFSYCTRVLSSSFNEPEVEPKCTMILASERCLRAFIQYLIVKDIKLDQDLPRYAVTFGHYVSAHLRERVRQRLDAVIVDRFSLSEVFGGATENPEDGWYSFDPLIIPEVISLTDGRPITNGKGELVLTTLYPFQEAQPIVRYATGDLVAVTYDGQQFPGEPSIKPLGRLRFSVLSGDSREVLLSAADLYEAIDVLPWPARRAVFRDAWDVDDPHSIGNPRYNVEYKSNGSKEWLLVRVGALETRSRDEDSERAHQVYQNLLSRSPALRQRIAGDKLTLSVSIVDELDSHWHV